MSMKSSQAIEIVRNLNFKKASLIICKGRLKSKERRIKVSETVNGSSDTERKKSITKITKETQASLIKVIESRRDEIILSYKHHFRKIEKETVDPEFTKDRFKNTIYGLIIQDKMHFETLRQYPSDWANLDKLGELWAYTILAESWQENHQPEKAYLISNLLKRGEKIDNKFLFDDKWEKNGKSSGTDFIRMLDQNSSKLSIERSAQNFHLIAKAHEVKVSYKSIRHVLKEGMKMESKRK